MLYFIDVGESFDVALPSSTKTVQGFIAAAFVIVSSVTACTAQAPVVPSTSSASASASTPAASPTPKAKPTSLIPSSMPGEKVITSLAPKHSGVTVGPYATSTGFIAVYVRCVGEGKIDVSILGSAAYSLDCTLDDSGRGCETLRGSKPPKNSPSRFRARLSGGWPSPRLTGPLQYADSFRGDCLSRSTNRTIKKLCRMQSGFFGFGTSKHNVAPSV